MRAALASFARTNLAGQFVWLELDYDQPSNEAFFARHLPAFPQLMVVDPESEAVTSLWTGSATAEQLSAFLTQALARPSGATGAADRADAALRRGDGLLAAGDPAGALTVYEAALAAGGMGWPARDHALEQLLTALQLSDPPRCAARAVAEAPRMARAHPFVTIALTGLSCAATDRAIAVSADARRLEALVNEALALPAASEDDHYQSYEALHAVRVHAGDPAGARAIATRYLTFVDGLAAPRSTDERLARDLARLRAETKLGSAARAIAALEATAAALPTSDTAASQLAQAYVAAGRDADAIAACGRGLALRPGPTARARLLATRARAAAHRGDVAAARRDLADGLAAAAAITLPSARSQTTSQLQRQLDALAAAPPSR
jgi:hypothetical protein